MARYIDADGLSKIKFHPLPYQYVVPSDVDKESYVRGWNDVIDGIIEEMPTADVVEVVRCKDCKYFEYNSVAKVNGIPLIVAHEICQKWGNGCKTSENGFCFLAERSEDDEAD